MVRGPVPYTWSDADFLSYLAQVRRWHLEVGDPYRPHDPFEWDGASRQEVYDDLHTELLELLDEAKRRGLDPTPYIYPDEPRLWGGDHG